MKSSVIHVEKLSKVYKLYTSAMDRFREALSPWKKKYHHDFFALKDLSLDIYEGEVVGILGANGAGKSTLLKILAGVLTPNSGEVKINGRVSALLELGMGFNPELSGEENVIFNATVLGLSPKSIQSKLAEIIEFADIGEYIEQPLKTYSSGMVARLAFAVAVNLDAEVLIIDEALSVGDVRFQQKAIRKMTQLMKKAKSIVFVSHSLDSIKRFCTRAIWLNAGEIVEDGNTVDVVQHYYTFMTTGDTPLKKGLTSSIRQLEKKVNTSTEDLQWYSTNSFESVGDGSGQIERIALYDDINHRSANIVSGGEELVMFLDVSVFKKISKPHISFVLRDKLGLNVFGVSSNHFGVHFESFQSGQKLLIKIRFLLPTILNGTYSFSVALLDISDATMKNKIHQVYDACVIQVESNDIKQLHGSLLIPNQASFEIS